MKLFEVQKISYFPPNKGYEVILEEVSGNIKFSILVGSKEAQAIGIALEDIQTPRPNTYDVILDILSSADIKIGKIEFYKCIKGTIYSKIYLKSIVFGVKSIDCRPSDSMAISVKYCCPISVSKRVLNKIKFKNIKSDNEFNSIEEYQSQQAFSIENVIIKLNKALENEIAKENYEAAAKLRDKIKSYLSLDK